MSYVGLVLITVKLLRVWVLKVNCIYIHLTIALFGLMLECTSTGPAVVHCDQVILYTTCITVHEYIYNEVSKLISVLFKVQTIPPPLYRETRLCCWPATPAARSGLPRWASSTCWRAGAWTSTHGICGETPRSPPQRCTARPTS